MSNDLKPDAAELEQKRLFEKGRRFDATVLVFACLCGLSVILFFNRFVPDEPVWDTTNRIFCAAWIFFAIAMNVTIVAKIIWWRKNKDRFRSPYGR